MARPKRERTDADVTRDTAITQGLASGDPRNPRKRPERIPMAAGANLDVNATLETEDYFYRWFAEHPGRGGRVERAKKAGYEICVDEHGSQVTRPSGDGKMYLMRLPREDYEDDMRTKRQKVRLTMDEHTRLRHNEYAPTSIRPEGGASSVVEHKETDNPFAG